MTITKTDILLYGALLEGDMYADGYGSTDKDAELMQKALKKIYGVVEGVSEEDLLKAEEQMKNDIKNLIIEFRGEMAKYLGEED